MALSPGGRVARRSEPGDDQSVDSSSHVEDWTIKSVP